MIRTVQSCGLFVALCVALLFAARVGAQEQDDDAAPVNDDTVAAWAANANRRPADLILSEVTGPGLAQALQLQSLSLNQSPLTDIGMSNIGKMSGLFNLSLNNTLITDAGLAALANLHNLEFLQLRHTKITDAGLASLAGLKKLRSLDLAGTDVTDAGINVLQGMPQLEELDLRGTFVSGAGFSKLKVLAGLKKLHVSIRSAGDLDALNQFDPSVSGALDLKLTDDEFQAFSKNNKRWGYSSTHVNTPKEETEQHEKIGQIVRTALGTKEAIVDLSSGEKRGFRGGEKIAPAPRMNTISIAELDSIAQQTSIRGLILRDLEMNDRLVAHLKPLTGLRVLSLGSDYDDTDFGTRNFSSGVTDFSLEYLAGITQLEKLDLWGTRLAGYGLVHLEGLTKLKTLNLGYTFINGTRLRHLKACAELTTLNLQFTRTRAADLALLLPLTKLQHLDLSGTHLTDAGIAQLKGLRALRTLNLLGTKVSLEAVNELKKVLPDLAVTPDGIAPRDSQPPSPRRSDMW